MEKYDYKPSFQTEFSAEEEDRFRNLMNKWACSIKGYNKRKFGNELKVLGVWETPIYVSTLKYQNDTRTIEHIYEKYNNQMIEPRTVFNENDFNRWDVCKAPEPFSENETAYRVYGSKHIEKCVTCNGSGMMTCPTCDGRRYEICGRCGGRGVVKSYKYQDVPCSSCKGTGYYIVSEHFFTDTATVDKNRPCSVCNSTGHVRKQVECMETCSTCRGSGKVTCSTCLGSGEVTCTTCGGNGKLLFFWVVRQEAFVSTRRFFLLPEQLSESDMDKYMDAFDRTDGKLVFQQCNDGISYDQNEFDQQDFTSQSLVSLAENLQNSAENQIVYNEFKTEEYMAKTVKYELDGKEYICILQGESWDIFSIKSPISDFMDEIKKDVISLSKRGRIGRAWTLAKRLLLFPQAGENERQVKEDLEEYLKNAAGFGKKLSIIIFLLAIFPVFVLQYNNNDYIVMSQWAHWLDGFLHITHAGDVFVFAAFDILCMLAIKLIGTPPFIYKHENFFARMLLGFLFGLACQTVIYLLFFGLRWIGVVAVFDFLFYWIFVIALYAVLIIYMIITFVIKMVVGLFKWIF